ncbi:MAG TPA: methyltransferase domain-containing protein [Streptosporangiaceae bacterium]|nr:methyltransferase domain-containing protein [Streptosporangiaceae bacterium]
MLDGAISFLRCPQCAHGGPLTRVGGTLRCGTGHNFDIARSGYVSLLGGPPKYQGDTPAMVTARRDFLAAGHFAGLADTLAEAAAISVTSVASVTSAASPGCVVDSGAGTGYYLARLLDRLPGAIGLALDVSKSALSLAAHAHRRVAAVGCDIWRQLPVADGAADLALSVFAPRNAAELARILRPGGRLLVGTPAADHLAELIGPLAMLRVDETKEQRLAAKLSPYFNLDAATEYRATVSLDHRAVGMLVTMGPSSWHTQPGELAAMIAELPDPVPVTVAVRLATYRAWR